ncbi:MAG: universal stress protein [Pirellulales bacterium]|nr:universal stress protein [Pirellulales bacterium]
MAWLPRRAVVVPIDFSDDSLAALQVAKELVGDLADLHTIHVLAIWEPNEPGIVWEMVDERSRAAHAADALQKKLAELGLEDARTIVRFGDPGHEIADYAREVNSELIVVSSRGRSGLTRLLIGSTAERVARLAHCPVLMLKR